MAITLTTSPANIVSPYRQVLWEVTSDRFGGGVHPVSNVSSGTGAFARYTNTGFITHNFTVGDIITGSTFSDDEYNVRQVVTVIIDTETYETDVQFVSDNAGTMTRTNDGFQVKGEVYGNDIEPLKTILQISASSGKIRIDITDHGYEVGDFVEVSGTTSYDDYYQVFSVPNPGSFVVAIAFVADEAGFVQKLTLIGSKIQQAIVVGGVDTFRFDFANLLQSIVQFDLIPIGGSAITTPNRGSLKPYVIQFIEQYDDVDGFIQDQDELIGTLGAKEIVNITLQHTEVQSLTKYTQDNISKEFLTTMPVDRELVGRGEHVTLAFLTNEVSLKTELREFDEAGGLTITIGSVTPIVENRGIIMIDVSTMLTTTVRFTMRLLTPANLVVSSTIQWFIDERCYPDPKRIWWLNRAGDFDQYTFTGNKNESSVNESTSYGRLIQQGFSVQDRGTTTLGVKSEDRTTVFSDFITEEQWDWLRHLYSSIEIYEQVGTELRPITLTTRSQRGPRGDELIKVRLSYVPANEPIIQRN